MKKSLVGSLAVLLVLLGLLLPLVLPRHCPVSRVACERITEGMTRAEVEEILGVPSGDYQTQPTTPFVHILTGGWSMVTGTTEVWVADEAELYVCFDGGVVEKVECAPMEPANAGPVELACWRLDKLKRCWLR